MMPGDRPSLFETMRAVDGRIERLGLHLARLEASAAALEIPLDSAGVDGGLSVVPLAGTHRVRLTAAPSGRVTVESAPLGDAPFRTAWICPDPMREAGSALCRHKTTSREHYEGPYGWAVSRGADEAILINERGDVVEGSRTSVWIARDGRLWTPSLDAGGLPGIERAHLLATREDAGEASMTPADLRAADAVYLSNALRGLMRVDLLAADGDGSLDAGPS